MKINYFNFRKSGNEFLLTNDFGNYIFLNERDFRKLAAGQLPDDKDTADRLRRRQFIYEDSELDYSERVSDLLLKSKGHAAQATSLHIFVVTTACNLSCIYCQANNGSHHTGLFMSKETARCAVDIALQSPEICLDFEFQGGEPLINFPVIRFIVEYAERKKGRHQIHYSLVSNLTLLTDEIIAFLRAYDISVSTSVDGSRLVHDHNRHYPGGGSSYDQVCRSIDRLREQEIPVGAIETTTEYSLHFPEEIVHAYRDLGFDSTFLRPLTPLGKAGRNWNDFGYTPEEYLAFYRRAFEEILRMNRAGNEMVEAHAAIFLKRIFGRYVNYMELRSPCGAGIGQIAYYADGKIFTCDEGRMLYEMGDGSFCIGDAQKSTYRDLIKNSVCRTACSASILESIPGCADCAYQPYCGVCPVVSYAHCQDVMEKTPHGYKCRIYMGMLDLLFQKIQENDPDTVNILKAWGC